MLLRSNMRVSPGSLSFAAVLAFCVLAAFVLPGCGGRDRADSATSGPEQRTPSGVRLGGTFRCVEVEDMRSLDPPRIGDIVSNHIATNIYDCWSSSTTTSTSSRRSRCGGTISDERPRVHVLPAPRRPLHDDPAFSGGKGRLLHAEDVKYSSSAWPRRNNSTGWWVYQGLIEGSTTTVKTRVGSLRDPGGRLADFEDPTHAPLRTVPEALGMAYGCVEARDAVEKYGDDYFQHPVGTGPFRFVSWAPNQEVVLEKNPHYWQVDKDGTRLPYLDRVEVRLISDAKTAFRNFDTGKLEQLEPIPPEFWTNIFDETAS